MEQSVARDRAVVPEQSEPGGSASKTSTTSTTFTPSRPSVPSATKHKRSFDFDTNDNSDHEKRSFKVPRLIMGRARETQDCRTVRSHSTTAARRDVFWPRDLLPLTIPNARVLTYGYDTKIRHAFVGPVSKMNVADHGWDLLCALEEVRRDVPSRPLLFIAHSLGGLVAKIALMKSRDFEHVKPHLHYIVASTVGVFFFGTPHRGADPLGPGIRQILTALAKGFAFKLNDSIVGTLMPSGEYLREIRDGFLSLAKQRNLVVYSFQEEYGVSGLGGKKVSSNFIYTLPSRVVLTVIRRSWMMIRPVWTIQPSRRLATFPTIIWTWFDSPESRTMSTGRSRPPSAS